MPPSSAREIRWVDWSRASAEVTVGPAPVPLAVPAEAAMIAVLNAARSPRFQASVMKAPEERERTGERGEGPCLGIFSNTPVGYFATSVEEGRLIDYRALSGAGANGYGGVRALLACQPSRASA